jgi:hypothetical protein
VTARQEWCQSLLFFFYFMMLLRQMRLAPFFDVWHLDNDFLQQLAILMAQTAQLIIPVLFYYPVII